MFTAVAIIYNKSIVFELLGEMTNVIAFEGDMDTGLASVSVFVIVTLRKLDVEFLS